VDNEYLYKLGVDTSDLDSAISATVSIIGELDNLLGQKMPRSTAAFVGGLEKVRTGLTDVSTDAARATTAVTANAEATDKATEATTRQVSANQQLIQSYREAAVMGTSSGVGTSNAANTALLNTQSVYGIGRVAAGQDYSAAASATELAAMKAYYSEEETLHQGMQDAILASANAAEQRRVALAQAEAKAIEVASQQAGEQRIAIEKMVSEELAALQTAQLEKFKSMQTAFVAEQQAAANSSRYGAQTGDFVTGNGTTNTRNRAALNTSSVTGIGSRAAQEEYSSQASGAALSGMAAYYAAQEQQAQGAKNLEAAQARLGVAYSAQSAALPRLRYALYDVSLAFGIAGTALTSVGGEIAKTTVEYQQLFAQVERTSSLKAGSLALAQLKTDLIGITEQLPATFADVTKIATLGNQLNIPAGSLVNFTKTVTEFSAETNVSVDAAATAFGRLGQILKTSDYKTLGDEIAYLGVKAVATESDIIKVAQQIAVTTTSYGLSEKQTLALATAYASLGIKAESARGTTSRAFADIGAAVQSGGTKLEEVARVAGTTSDAFTKLFQTDPNQALTEFLTGLGKSGSNAKAILAELGITAQRDITNLSLLGQNIKVLNDANENAGKSAGFMDKAYQSIANTVQSQLTIAGNKVQSIFNDIGSSAGGPIADLVKGLNDVLDIIDRITKDPGAAGGLAISVSIVTLTGAVLLALAGLAAFKANALAVGTALDQLGLKNVSVGGAIKILLGTQTQETDAVRAAKVALDEKRIALAELAAAEEAAAAAGDQLTASNVRQAASSEAGAAAAGEQAGAEGLRTAEGLAATGAAAKAAAPAVAELGVAESGAALAGGGLLDILLGPAGLAIGIGALLIPTIPALVDGLDQFISKADGATLSVDQLTQSIKGLNATGSKETADQIAQALSYGGKADYSVGNSTAVNPATGQQYNAGTTKSFSGARAYYNETQGYDSNRGFSDAPIGQTNSQATAFKGQVQTVDATLAGFAQSKDYADLNTGLSAYLKTLKDSGLSQKQLEGFLSQTATALGATKGQTLEAAVAAAKEGDATAGQTAKKKAFTDALSDYITKAFDSSTKTDALSTSLGALGTEYATAGAATASGSTQMTNAIKAIVDQAGSASKAKDELEGLYQSLLKSGLATTSQLAPLLAVIKDYGGSGDAAGTAVPKIQALADAYDKAATKADASATATSRTAMQYGQDLQSTITAALGYQFGVQDSTDKITSGWKSISDNAATARASIAGIKSDLLSLTATKAQDTYDIKIAQLYGDTIGEAKAKADLAKTNADLASKHKDLDKAQQDSSKSLTGNTAGAIANRAALEGQIQNYGAYITSLAESGASQKQVQAAITASRNEFVKQATQLGLNKGEVDKYATAFTGMTKIVKAIPKNLTTTYTVHTDAATKAIDDYRATLTKAQKAAATAHKLAIPTISPKDAPTKLGQKVGTDILTGLNGALSPQQQKNIIQLLGGTPNAVAKTLLPSSVGVPMYNFAGTPLANTASQGRAPASATPAVVIQSSGGTTKLSTADKQFLHGLLAGKPSITISASQFGKAIDNANVKAGTRGGG
jgi:TP901 family phage tail tape measure protein